LHRDTEKMRNLEKQGNSLLVEEFAQRHREDEEIEKSREIVW